MYSHYRQRADVNRTVEPLIAARNDVARTVRAHHRDSALMQPRQARRVEPGHRLHRVPRPLALAPARASVANQQHVAFFDVYLMILLSRVEIFGKDPIAGLHPFDLFDLRYVQQHAAAHYAVGRDVDRAFARAMRSDFARVEAVVHLAPPEHVTECVEMGDGVTVR